MLAKTDLFDLAGLRLTSGEGRRLELAAEIEPFDLTGAEYAVTPRPTPVTLDISRTTHDGWALRIRFSATLHGPCMRCLEDASPTTDVDAREVSQPGGGEELSSPYVVDEQLDVQAWAHDALALALPAQIRCRPDCAGLCAECGADLNAAGPDHHHDPPPDPRWAKLRELKLE